MVHKKPKRKIKSKITRVKYNRDIDADAEEARANTLFSSDDLEDSA